MAYDYNKYKSVYQGLNDKQKQQWDTKYGDTQEYKQFMSDYQNEVRNNPVNNYGDTGGASNATKYTGTGVSSAGNYTYNQNLTTQGLANQNFAFGNNAVTAEKNSPGYLQNRNNYIANALYNEGKTDRASVEGYLSNFSDYTNYDKVGQQNTVDAIMNRMGSIATKNDDKGYSNNADSINSGMMNDMGTNFNNYKNGYSNLMGGGNYASNFDEAVLNKLKTAYGIESLDEFRQRYPEQYDSLMQSLETVRPVRDATNPTQRQMLDGQLQGIIGAGVGAGSDWSKLNVLESSIMNKFENPEQIKQDAQNILKLQTEGRSIPEIAERMGMSEDQVQQLVLLANGLDSKAGEYYKLNDKAAKDITEPYDKKLDRAEIEKNIALERANRQVERLKEDFDTNMERQQKANEVNLHNADFLSGQYGYGFSKRGIEGLQYTSQQAQNIIDDLCKNYDRNNQQLADGIADIIRNWERYNEDITKASEEALTQAKNNYTSNMLAIQQQYGTVGMQAQQQLSNNVQSFITTAENIYDNMLQQQQQNLTNLITNAGNLNALSMQNLTLRQAKIQQFQNESLNLNRNQLQNLADQLGMDKETYQDLVNYQVQAVANQLNGYIPGAGVQMQSQIQSLLDQGYSPNQAMQSIMNSEEFKALQQSGNNEWSMNNGIMYNKATGEYVDLNGDEYGTVGNNLYNKRTGEVISGQPGSNYVSYETVDGKTYGVSQKTYNTLANFMNQYSIGDTGGQCGTFVKKYLSSLGITRPNISKLSDKKAQINTPQGYSPQIGDVVIMDSPYAETKANGHIAIITGINDDGSFTTLESNRKNNDEKVFSRTINPSKTKVHGYYHPDGVADSSSLGGETNESAKQVAQAIMNGTASLPAKNSKIYGDVVIELDKMINEKYGGALPKGLDLINYSVKNEKQLDNSAVEALDGTFTSLYNAEYLMQTLEENKKKTGPLISKLYKLNPRDADYANIKAQINSMSSKIARGFGEKGVLTDMDIERYMKAIPNEKLGDKANEVVGDLLQAKLYKGLMNTLEQYARAGRDVHLWADDYRIAQQWLQQHNFIEGTSGGGRGGLSGGGSMSGGGGRG